MADIGFRAQGLRLPQKLGSSPEGHYTTILGPILGPPILGKYQIHRHLIITS